MKKDFLFSMGLLIALFTLFSCGGGKDDGDEKKRELPENPINGHEYVDLGLPSGTLWAMCNVGATKPEEFGGYYAWGETEEKTDYSLENYKWCDGDEYSKTKYCTDRYFGKVDNITILDPQDDVAHVKWGGSWRMPTIAEQNELLHECTWVWTTRRGVEGYRVIGSNGNSIFLPAADGRYGTVPDDNGKNAMTINEAVVAHVVVSTGCYWSRSLHGYSSNNAYILYIDRYDHVWDFDQRYVGHMVRPVCD